jgi:hypothetical protein
MVCAAHHLHDRSFSAALDDSAFSIPRAIRMLNAPGESQVVQRLGIASVSKSLTYDSEPNSFSQAQEPLAGERIDLSHIYLHDPPDYHKYCPTVASERQHLRQSPPLGLNVVHP